MRAMDTPNGLVDLVERFGRHYEAYRSPRYDEPQFPTPVRCES